METPSPLVCSIRPHVHEHVNRAVVFFVVLCAFGGSSGVKISHNYYTANDRGDVAEGGHTLET